MNICDIMNVLYSLFLLCTYYKSDLCPSTSSFVDLCLLITENTQWLLWFKLVPLLEMPDDNILLLEDTGNDVAAFFTDT